MVMVNFTEDVLSTRSLGLPAVGVARKEDQLQYVQKEGSRDPDGGVHVWHPCTM